MLQEGEEANTTVDSEGKEEVAAEEAEPKPPRELTAEELEAKVNIILTIIRSLFYSSNDESLRSVLSRLE